uniref:Reverse transcriptase domain-containing protein n=1 Tax=Angiostrongylus cantonensis TaxID=6313 RepID=A0A0K0DQD1_ANGCA
MSLFCNDINVDVKRWVRQGGAISPKLFTAPLENVVRTLERDNMKVRIDDQQLYHLRFADDIVSIAPIVSHAERMLSDYDEA